MDYYSNADEQLRGAKILAEAGEYRTSITLLFLACELYLKSILEKIDSNSKFLDKHDIINIASCLKNEINYEKISSGLAFLRKYHNDSRYPFNSEIYTKDFFDECLQVVLDVKSEVDTANSKKSTKQRLEEKFGKDNVK